MSPGVGLVVFVQFCLWREQLVERHSLPSSSSSSLSSFSFSLPLRHSPRRKKTQRTKMIYWRNYYHHLQKQGIVFLCVILPYAHIVAALSNCSMFQERMKKLFLARWSKSRSQGHWPSCHYLSIYMPNMQPVSLTVQKLQWMLKLTTDKQTNRQTGQKQYAPNHSIRGHKKTFHFFMRP